MYTATANLKYNSWALSLFTWAVVLMISDLPNAVWQAVLSEVPTWLFWAKISLLLVLIFTSMVWKPIQIVRPYFFLMLVLLLALYGSEWLQGTSNYQQWWKRVNWTIGMAGFELIKLAVAFIMVAVLLLMRRRWKDFFLAWGHA